MCSSTAPWPWKDHPGSHHRQGDGGRAHHHLGTGTGKGGDLVGLLTNLQQGDILFIDEIHRIPKAVEEFLYPAMEDFSIDIVFDKGVHARSHRFRLNRFILIGATTRIGLLSAPFEIGSACSEPSTFTTPTT